MATLPEQINALLETVYEQRLRARHEFGFDPYGVALHPADVRALRLAHERFAEVYARAGEPETLMGLLVYTDVGVKRGTLEVLSEEEARRRFAEHVTEA